MAPPKGNSFWKLRAKHGRDKLFTDPLVLFESCCEYFQEVEDNPLYETKAWNNQGVIVTEAIPLMRAMTIGGLCIFLDITKETWGQYRKQNDFSDLIHKVEEIIRDQKFGGAAAGLLNANIIARDLGLKDASEQDHKSSDGTMSPKQELSGDALRKELDKRGLKIEFDGDNE